MDVPSIRGVIAQVKYTYFTAAAIEGYMVIREDNAGATWTATGRVVVSDPYLLTLRPLLFVAPIQGGAFRWPVHAIEVIDGRLVAKLGSRLQ